MLQMRPNCECCDKDLHADATDAMICSYECTFCQNCVEKVLLNVCPNCGGGFTARPIRVKKAYRPEVSLVHQPASEERIHTCYDHQQIQAFSSTLKHIAPEKR